MLYGTSQRQVRSYLVLDLFAGVVDGAVILAAEGVAYFGERYGRYHILAKEHGDLTRKRDSTLFVSTLQIGDPEVVVFRNDFLDQVRRDLLQLRSSNKFAQRLLDELNGHRFPRKRRVRTYPYEGTLKLAYVARGE